ncbi:MAG: hypothetical protein EXS35_18620 [Pedosphaera sp.]|nr:hypothetical protein [Pedosphaera sp.]
MKLTIFNPTPSGRAHGSERGSMVLAMMVILTLMLIYVAATVRTLTQLRQELKLVEQKQIQRLQSPAPAATRTNSAALAP